MVTEGSSQGSLPDASPVVPSRARQDWTRPLGQFFIVHREVTIFAVLVVLIVFFAVKNGEFLTYDNIVTIGQYVAPVAVIGSGEVLLLTLGEIDLSAGQTFLMSAWITLWLQQDGIPIGWAITISLLCCAAVGAFNGLFTILFNVPSFVTTLGTYYALLGIVLIVSNDEQVSMVGITGRFGQIFGMSNWAEMFWALGIVVVLHVLLKAARFGWHVTATGGNKLGASEAGIPASRVKIWCFVIVALGAGFIGILDSIRVESLDPASPGTSMMFSAVSAAVIGGTALTGGRGTIIGAFLGACVLGVLNDGFELIGVSANTFTLMLGLVILAAMALNSRLGVLGSSRSGR